MTHRAICDGMSFTPFAIGSMIVIETLRIIFGIVGSSPCVFLCSMFVLATLRTIFSRIFHQ